MKNTVYYLEYFCPRSGWRRSGALALPDKGAAKAEAEIRARVWQFRYRVVTETTTVTRKVGRKVFKP